MQAQTKTITGSDAVESSEESYYTTSDEIHSADESDAKGRRVPSENIVKPSAPAADKVLDNPAGMKKKSESYCSIRHHSSLTFI